MRDVLILITGGTIDKVHNERTESLNFNNDATPLIPDILTQGRCDFVHKQTLFLKDSLDFDDADRAAIVAAIQAATQTSIVVTHGTGTMGQSARKVAEHITGKTVVFTGAMRPHSLGKSDGSFNLGGAIIAAQTLPQGIYGVMNGRVFEAEKLNKNTEHGRSDI